MEGEGRESRMDTRGFWQRVARDIHVSWLVEHGCRSVILRSTGHRVVIIEGQIEILVSSHA